MVPYYNPQLQILTAMKYPILPQWHHDNFRVVFWRLYWNSQPGAEIHFDGQVHRLTPDRLLLVPPYTVIRQRLPQPPVKHWSMHFIADPPFDHVRHKIFTFRADSSTMRRIWSLSPACDVQDIDKVHLGSLSPVCDEEDIGNVHLGLLVRALVHGLLARIPPADINQVPKLSEPLERGIAYIEANLSEPLHNRDIAEQMNMSVNAALREFHAGIQVSMQAYVRHIRSERASLLLHDPQRSLKQVADECGYYDRYHFSRAFKAQHNMTPLAYRRWLNGE